MKTLLDKVNEIEVKIDQILVLLNKESPPPVPFPLSLQEQAQIALSTLADIQSQLIAQTQVTQQVINPAVVPIEEPIEP